MTALVKSVEYWSVSWITWVAWPSRSVSKYCRVSGRSESRSPIMMSSSRCMWLSAYLIPFWMLRGRCHKGRGRKHTKLRLAVSRVSKSRFAPPSAATRRCAGTVLDNAKRQSCLTDCRVSCSRTSIPHTKDWGQAQRLVEDDHGKRWWRLRLVALEKSRRKPLDSSSIWVGRHCQRK